MKKEIKKAESTEIVKKFTDEEVDRLLKKDLAIENDPRNLLKKFKDEVLPSYFSEDKNKKMNQEEFNDKANQVMIAFGPDTHLPLAHAVSTKYQPLALELTRRLKKEHDCQSTSEVMLAETIALSHTRALELSSKFAVFKDIEYLSAEKNGYYGLIAKEIDRAHRRMMHSLSLLKQMKQPLVEVNIKSKNTFLAQNQQFNAEKPPETTKNEINDSK